MSVYSDSGRSVGQGLATGIPYSVDNPQYKAITDAVAQRVAAATEAKSQAKLAAEPSLVTVTLDTEELTRLSAMYPEFATINYGHSRPGHAAFVQSCRFANEWLAMQAAKLSDSVTHLGGSVLSYLIGPLQDVQLIRDPTNTVAVHENHALTVDSYRVFEDYVSVGKDIGKQLSRTKYEDYLGRKCMNTVLVGETMKKSEVLCVDLAMHAMTPYQVAGMMLETSADVCFGFFMYTPQMLLESSGELADTGIHFKKTTVGVDFLYPEGPAGAVHYDYSEWEPWLVGHTFRLGSVPGRAKWYQVELLKNRGPLMFFRMVALPYAPSEHRVSHALDTGLTDAEYVVTVPELKADDLDPDDPKSWVIRRFLASKRVVDRTYEHCMQLDQAQFTRYAVRKYLHATNDRVTVNGTSVRVNTRLGAWAVTGLLIAVYAKAFDDRYRAGKLTQEVMEHIKSKVDGKRSVKSYVASVLRYTGATGTVSFLDTLLSRVAVSVYAPDIPTAASVTFSVPPSYVLVGESVSLSAGVLRRVQSGEFDREYAALTRPVMSLPGSLCAAATSVAAGVVEKGLAGWSRFVFRVEGESLFKPLFVNDPQVTATFGHVTAVNDVDAPEAGRYLVEAEVAVRQVRKNTRVDFLPDPDPVSTLNAFYRTVNPGVGAQDLEYDTSSISLDPQDRVIAADRLRLPLYFGEPPRSRKLYHSRLEALNVPKRQSTVHELLSSASARNMNAPQVAIAQDDEAMVHEVWSCFLDTACRADARELLASYARDPVGLHEQSFKDWATQSTPDKLKRVRKALEEVSASLGDMDVSEYLMMLKSDVKPDLTTKPIESRIEPQVIVYHATELNALYSSLFRVLVRRFTSLLRPNYLVNLLKDMVDVEAFVRGVHPFSASVQYLENDFSKYDKSQGRFVFMLEHFVFEQLGMNSELLDKWVAGHVDCSLRSLSLGMSLHTLFQRKSGDATTSFGNVLLNVLSVTYAYRGTQVLWAVFMGDDSLVCAATVANTESAARVLAEVFNLGAKTYLTEAPYFASNFLLVSDRAEDVAFVPDPVKRVARWSMSIDAEDPQWHERYISAVDSMRVYLNSFNTVGLERAVSLRYAIEMCDVTSVASAVATVVSDEKKFRSMWRVEPDVSVY